MRFRPAGLLAALIGVLTGVGPAWVSAAELSLPADLAIEKAIDTAVDAGLTQANLSAAVQASDEGLIRRLMLDLAGRIPAQVEVQAFASDSDPGKRAKLVDRLLGSPEYIEFQAGRLSWAITAGEGDLSRYLRVALTENRPWDRIFRELILADGAVNSDEKDNAKKEVANSAAEYMRRRVRDADELTIDVSVAFFGVNVGCAKCHDHPHVKEWTQETFYGMKSFLNRTFESGGFIGEREYGGVKYQTTKGENRDAKPRFFTGAFVDEPTAAEPNGADRKKQDEAVRELAKKRQPPPPPKFSRRAKLVETALADGQRMFFARAIANRLWHQYFGQGLVMPLDQMHAANPPSHPELLDWLARDLITHGYDLRRLTRGLVLSQAYSRGSRWESGERPDPKHFAVAIPRPLTATQLARSLSLAVAEQESFAKTTDIAERAKRIAGSASTSNSDKFSQPGENFQVTASEALLFSNGSQIERTYLNGPLVKELAKLERPEDRVSLAVRRILSREPDEEEAKLLASYLTSRQERREDACRQLVWALLTSGEFRFNH